MRVDMTAKLTKNTKAIVKLLVYSTVNMSETVQDRNIGTMD